MNAVNSYQVAFFDIGHTRQRGCGGSLIATPSISFDAEPAAELSRSTGIAARSHH